MKHKPEVIQSAHSKQKRKYLGEGGVVFTQPELDALADNAPMPEAKEGKA